MFITPTGKVGNKRAASSATSQSTPDDSAAAVPTPGRHGCCVVM